MNKANLRIKVLDFINFVGPRALIHIQKHPPSWGEGQVDNIIYTIVCYSEIEIHGAVMEVVILVLIKLS